jgi:hypothetical protein
MTVDAVSDLDLSYTPPLGSPWDAVQIATQAWAGVACTCRVLPLPAMPRAVVDRDARGMVKVVAEAGRD